MSKPHSGLKRRCPICNAAIEPDAPATKIYCSKAHADKARGLPRVSPGSGGIVNLADFNKFPQEVKNRILLGHTGASIGFFDIEATHLEASIGRVLCCVIQGLPPDSVPAVYHAHERRYKKPDNFDDSVLVADIRDALEKYDIIVGHNSKMFDTKFINARNLRAGERTKRPQYQVDTLWAWRSKAKAWSSLRSIQHFLNTPTEKTGIAWGSWMNALGWDKRLRADAMSEIVDHCIRDVKALREVYIRLVKADVIRSIRMDGGAL